MADEKVYQDVAALIGDRTDDAWQAMAESYALLGLMLVAVLQNVGKVRVPAEWVELAQGFVMTATPQADGSWVFEAVRHGEVKSDTREAARRMSEKWERQYVRREDVDG